MQPIQGIRFIHNAIRRGVVDIEAAVDGVSSRETAAALATRVTFLAHEVHMHTSGEEEAIYPLLDERARNVARHYLFDHDEEEALFARLATLLADWSGAPAYGNELRRAAASLRYHALLHVKKEDDIIVPLVMQHFTADEQAQMIQRAVSRYTPDQLAQTFPWIVSAQTLDDRVAFIVDDLMKLMPPQVFGAVKGWIRAGLPVGEWDDIVQRAPQLADR
jgi:iron-sulfur cluster repair protein YtfE (RIC family)